jgi:hypothetical protein
MLNALSIRPPLNQLMKLIEKVPDYPISNRQLVTFARRNKAPAEVVDFYRTISDDRIYESKDELAGVSEQIDIMRHDEADMPAEIERGPEEY